MRPEHRLYELLFANIERGHVTNLQDVEQMIRHRLVDPGRLLEFFRMIEPQLVRYPALDAASFLRTFE